jgi:hypothetical protein
MDPVYFGVGRTWQERVQDWESLPQNQGFATSNQVVAENAINEPDAGLRAVVNISAAALLSLLPHNRYLNLYDRPLVGTARPEPSPDRVRVDVKIGIRPRHTYFAAVALGGAGVRYYGEYCMVLKLGIAHDATQLLDRDSYDLLLPPLADIEPDDPKSSLVVERIRGRWGPDLRNMVLLRVLPELERQPRLVTSGTVAAMVLRDQEFIEVHLDLPNSFTLADTEEVRESPDEVAVEARLRNRLSGGRAVSAVEWLWLLRRELVARGLDDIGKRTRVVTAHGQGYQWK